MKISILRVTCHKKLALLECQKFSARAVIPLYFSVNRELFLFVFSIVTWELRMLLFLLTYYWDFIASDEELQHELEFELSPFTLSLLIEEGMEGIHKGTKSSCWKRFTLLSNDIEFMWNYFSEKTSKLPWMHFWRIDNRNTCIGKISRERKKEKTPYFHAEGTIWGIKFCISAGSRRYLYIDRKDSDEYILLISQRFCCMRRNSPSSPLSRTGEWSSK